MKLGFTGTRFGMTDLQKATFKSLLTPLEEFHHGSCQGSDVQAAQMVRQVLSEYYVQIIAHPGPDSEFKLSSGVDDQITESKTHFARNRDIVNLTDEMIATPFEMTEQSAGGTWYTIKYAIKMGKKVTIIWPDGSKEVK